MKTCRTCGEQKPLDEYHKSKDTKDGHTTLCKDCQREAGRRWREQNVEHRKAQRKAYYETNKAKICAATKAYHEANQAKQKRAQAAWRKENAEKVKARKREWEAANAKRLKTQKRQKYLDKIEAWKARNKAWREIHKDQVLEYRRQLADSLAPSYVAGLLRMRTATVTPELLQMKRDEIALRRLARLLKETCNANQQNG